MKKFLLILIIAVIACVEVEEKVQKENELEVNHHDFLDSIDFEDPNIVELKQPIDYASIIAKLHELIKSGNIQGKDLFEKVKDVIEKGKDILKDLNGIELAPDTLKKEGIWDEVVNLTIRNGDIVGYSKCRTVVEWKNCYPIAYIINEVFFNS